MAWSEDFHPEVGYLLPSLRVRRLLRFGLLAGGFGLMLGIGGTLALVQAPWAKSSPIKPSTLNLTTPENSLPEEGDSMPTGTADTALAGLSYTDDSPVRQLWPARTSRARCVNASPSPNQACSFHRNHAAVASAMEAAPSQALSSIPGKAFDDGAQQSKRPQKGSVQTRRHKPTLEAPEYPRQYGNPGVQYGFRAYPDHGGFW
jgi:hypothetical protein